jgi:hypothetical protein
MVRENRACKRGELCAQNKPQTAQRLEDFTIEVVRRPDRVHALLSLIRSIRESSRLATEPSQHPAP